MSAEGIIFSLPDKTSDEKRAHEAPRVFPSPTWQPRAPWLLAFTFLFFFSPCSRCPSYCSGFVTGRSPANDTYLWWTLCSGRQCLSSVFQTMDQVVEDLHFEIMITKPDEASQCSQFAPLPVCCFCCLLDGAAASGGFLVCGTQCLWHSMCLTQISNSLMAAFCLSDRLLSHC